MIQVLVCWELKKLLGSIDPPGGPRMDGGDDYCILGGELDPTYALPAGTFAWYNWGLPNPCKLSGEIHSGNLT